MDEQTDFFLYCQLIQIQSLSKFFVKRDMQNNELSKTLEMFQKNEYLSRKVTHGARIQN